MVDPKPRRPVGRPRKAAIASDSTPAPAKTAASPAKSSAPAKPVAAPAGAKDAPAKVAPPVEKVAAKAPVPSKGEAAPVEAVKAAVEAPAKVAAASTKVVAGAAPKAVEPKVVVPAVAAPKTVAPKIVAEPAAVAPKIVEKVVESVAAVAETVSVPTAQTALKGFFAMSEKLTPQSFVPTPESFQALFGDVSSRTKKAMETSAKLAEEMGEFAKGNVEALMTSSRVAAKGAETLGQEAASYSKKSLETATSAFKGFAAAKSPSELFKLQSDYARTSFDAAVAESSKFSEAVMKLFGEITQPISSRVALAAEKIKAPAF